MSHGDPDNWWVCDDCGVQEGQKPGDRMEGWKLDTKARPITLRCPRCATKATARASAE